jgi:hypothetical protein
MIRSEGKRLDGLTLVPWQGGRCATWNVTVTHIVADCFVGIYRARHDVSVPVIIFYH